MDGKFVSFFITLLVIQSTVADTTCTLPSAKSGEPAGGFQQAVKSFQSGYAVKTVLSEAGKDSIITQETYFNSPNKAYKSIGSVKLLTDQPNACYFGGILHYDKPLLISSVIGKPTSCNATTRQACAKMINIDDIYNYSYDKDPISAMALWLEVMQTSTKAVYTGVTQIRNRYVNSWQACIARGKGVLKVSFYTAVKQWDDVTGMRSSVAVPVAMSVTGNVNTKKIDKTFHFYDFERYIRSSFFMLPIGYGCSNYNSTKKFPEIPDQLAFRGSYITKYYSGRQQLTEYQLLFDGSQDITVISTYRVDSWYRYIQDYQQGLLYKESYDLKTGEVTDCDVVSLDDDSMPYIIKRGPIAHITHPSSFFGTDVNTYYLGMSWVDDVLCDVYENVRYNHTSLIVGKTFQKFVTTLFFDTSKVKTAYHGRLVPDDVLVQAQFTVYAGGRSTVVTLQITDYHQMYRSIELSDCFMNDNKKAIYMKMSSANFTARDYYHNRKVIKSTTKSQLSGMVNISPLRISEFRTHFYKNTFFATFYLLSAPSPSARFSLYSNYGRPPMGSVAMPAKQPDDCPRFCLNQTTPGQCLSYYTCADGPKLTCYLSMNVKHKPGTHYVTVPHYCKQYVAGAYSSLGLPATNKVVINAWNTSVEQGYLTYAVELENSHTKKLRKAVFNVTDFAANADFYYPHRQPLDYEKVKDGYTLKPDTAGVDLFSTTSPSHSECIRRCDLDETCETVSYCSTTHVCYGSSLVVDQDSISGSAAKYVYKEEDCAVFNRPYMKNFLIISRQASLEPADYQMQAVKTESICARTCYKFTNFTCRMYEYCSKQKVCSLFKRPLELTHFDRTKDHSTCSSAMRVYASEFKYISYSNITSYTGEVLEQMNYFNCTEQCYFDNSCTDAYYCYKGLQGDQSGHNPACILSGKSSTSHKIGHSIECLHVHKLKVATSGGKTAASTSKSKKKGVSGGATAGIAIVMLLVGGVIALAVFFGATRLRRKAPRNDDISIAYSRDDFHE